MEQPQAEGARRWASRIIGHGEIAPDQLLANPRNFRIHPESQQAALVEVLGVVGWVQDVIVNQRTGFMVDGHARVTLAMRHQEPTVPVTYVDLSDEEERLVLASFDAIGAMAGIDGERFRELHGELPQIGASTGAVLDGLRASLGLPGDPVPTPTPPAPRLVDRFGVPPFSVLDARQGYWQDRKRAWLALGIKSELGRGAPTGGSAEPLARLNAGQQSVMNERKGRKPNAIPGGAPMPLDRAKDKKRQRANATPGGSPKPHADAFRHGTKARGDGRGRPIQ